jgi:hypothetical protein
MNHKEDKHKVIEKSSREGTERRGGDEWPRGMLELVIR